MRAYPMFVSLEGRSCLVVGAGQVGLRKIEALAQAGPARLLVVDREAPGEALLALASRPGVEFARREFAEADLDGMFLVIASTSSAEVNARIAGLCRERGILCNIADAPEDCSFIVPASLRRGELTIAVSTGGSSPALARHVRQELERTFGEEYALFLELMGRLRPLVLGLGQETAANTEMFRALVGCRLLEALKAKDMELARAELTAQLPPQLHAQLHALITEILHGLA